MTHIDLYKPLMDHLSGGGHVWLCIKGNSYALLVGSFRKVPGGINNLTWFPLQALTKGLGELDKAGERAWMFEDLKIKWDNQDKGTGALKQDSDKPRFTLLDQVFIWGVVKVLEFGSRKYAVNNWRKGFKYSRILDAVHRHLKAFQEGERCDPESGLHHLDHAACCLMFLRRFDATADELPGQAWVYPRELDDRQSMLAPPIDS